MTVESAIMRGKAMNLYHDKGNTLRTSLHDFGMAACVHTLGYLGLVVTEVD